MEALTRFLRLCARMRSRLSSFPDQSQGSVLVETAFLVPILLVLLTGGIEVSRFILLDQKIARVASNVTDLTARTDTPSEDDIDQVFSAIDYISSPFEIGDNGVVIISSVSRAVGSTTTRVNWQRTGGGDGPGESRIGAPGDIADLPSVVQLREGQALIVGEAFYRYEPFFFEGFIEPRTVYHTAYYRPRDVAMELEQGDGDDSGGGGSDDDDDSGGSGGSDEDDDGGGSGGSDDDDDDGGGSGGHDDDDDDGHGGGGHDDDDDDGHGGGGHDDDDDDGRGGWRRR